MLKRTKSHNLGLWWRTIRDIPPRQLAARVEFELKKRSLPKLPLFLRYPLALGIQIPTPALRQDYLQGLELPHPLPIVNPPADTYSFTFLNQTKELDFPLTWNSTAYSRLWQFHLHYFDWIRDILITGYRQGAIDSYSLGKIQYLISDWIAANPLYSFDGWHPYTTSLRIVNWTYAIRAIPSLANPAIATSLWRQLNYLQRHKEYFAGGNHLLENLRAIIIGGLNFSHPQAEKYVQVAVNQLCQQLSLQILPDGCHYERSPMYHLIVMNLVAESVACLGNAGWTVPETIVNYLEKMLQFALGIRLAKGSYPLWNDAAYNGVQTLDEVTSWVSQLLCKAEGRRQEAEGKSLLSRLELKFQANSSSHLKMTKLKVNLKNLVHFNGLKLLALDLNPRRIESSKQLAMSRLKLTPMPNVSPLHTGTTDEDLKLPSPSASFPDSGYYILRNCSDIELAFDCALPCPQELPPHAHADCLTIDLYFQGRPIIVDTGTSEYTAGEIRDRERSTLAHNTITIANQNQSEIWGSFRVGDKAQPFNLQSGYSPDWQWVSAAHNGYCKPPLQSLHHRWVGLGTREIVIIDYLETLVSTNYISTLHFAPGLVLNYHPDTEVYECQLENNSLYLKVIGLEANDEVQWLDAKVSQSWYAPEFGLRYPRGLLQLQGTLPPKGKVVCIVMKFDSPPEVIWNYSNGQGVLEFEDKRALKWLFQDKCLVSA
ncbi:MAG: hypothetical protein F6J86_08605 [Symploca sp. SIO1B1]|nr:hypothetical protein [Symploca sp. SIO1B1]